MRLISTSYKNSSSFCNGLYSIPRYRTPTHFGNYLSNDNVWLLIFWKQFASITLRYIDFLKGFISLGFVSSWILSYKYKFALPWYRLFDCGIISDFKSSCTHIHTHYIAVCPLVIMGALTLCARSLLAVWALLSLIWCPTFVTRHFHLDHQQYSDEAQKAETVSSVVFKYFKRVISGILPYFKLLSLNKLCNKCF